MYGMRCVGGFIVKKIVEYLRRISNFLERITGYVSMALVATMLAVVMIQVVLRFFRASVPWSEELSRMLLIWIGMLGAGIAAKEGLHVGVDFVVSLLPKTIQRIISILINTVLIAFLVFFAKQGFNSAVAAKRVLATTMPMNMFVPKLALPVGALLMMVYLLNFVVSDVCAMITGKKQEEN